MKKIIILATALVVVAGILTACGCSASGKTGWEGNSYYRNGEMVKDSIIDDYYVDTEGQKRVISGRFDVKGETYFFVNGKIEKNKWVQDSFNEKYFYCGEDGKLLKNQWVEDTYYLNYEGAMLTNSVTPDGQYVDANGKKIVASDTQQNIKEENSNTDFATIWKLPDGTVQMGGTPQEGWVKMGDSSMVEDIPSQNGTTAQQNNLKNDKLLKDYNEYKQSPDDYMVKFDSNGNLWVRRWVSECMQLIYDYTILYVDGKIDSYITDFEKVGSASYDFHWMKNGNKIDESEFRQIENQFNNMTDQYSSIY